MELGLKDKIALVTGTGSQAGIGKAVALTLAKEGCHIISCDVDLAGAEKTAVEVRALKRKASAFKVDITDRNQINEVIKESLKQFSQNASSYAQRTSPSGITSLQLVQRIRQPTPSLEVYSGSNPVFYQAEHRALLILLCNHQV